MEGGSDTSRCLEICKKCLFGVWQVMVFAQLGGFVVMLKGDIDSQTEPVSKCT